MNNSIIVKGLNYLVIGLAIAFFGYALYVALFGMGETFGLLGGLALTVPIAGITAKGPFSVIEERTKKDKPALLILFDKTEKGEKALAQMELLCRVANIAFFSWPTKNTDKAKYVAKGMLNNEISRELLNNYSAMTVATAQELEEKGKKARAAEKEAKKEAKANNKATGNSTTAKIAAINDMVTAGILAKEAGMEAISKLFS